MFRRTRTNGEDLEGLDIERGRERGIAGYNDYRELCKLQRAKYFEEFYPEISVEMIEVWKAIYKHPDDVDLFVGRSQEALAYGSVVGPTFHCIIREQFYRYKYGDRFWYEFGGFPNSFSSAQLTEIRKMTLARLLCSNGDNITHMQADELPPDLGAKPVAALLCHSSNELECVEGMSTNSLQYRIQFILNKFLHHIKNCKSGV